MINWQLTGYPLTSITWSYRGFRCRWPIKVEYFLKLSADKLQLFKWSQAQVKFLKFILNMLCLCATQLKFWIQSDLGYENSGSYYRQGRQLLLTSRHGHALVTLYVQFLCSYWSKFDRWVHAENLCSIFKLVYFDSWSWQSFVSTCDVFNCLFPLDVQNEIQLLSGVFCYSWLVCLLGFWLRNTSLVKVGNPISDGIVFVFRLAWCLRGLKSMKRFWPYLIAFRSCISIEW